MAKTKLMKEVVLTCPNQVGALAKVTSALTESQVNIEACCCYTMDKTANFHIVTADAAKTMGVCKKAGWDCKESPVVCCELTNKVGTLAETTKKLSQAGVDIDYCYTSTGDGSMTKVILATKDNNKAVKVLS